MHRFFTENITDNKAVLSAEDSAHAVKVLRLCAGDTVCICDGRGADYDGEITLADKNATAVSVTNKRPAQTESHLEISLVQALPKIGKMDVIIQKCVELGVCDFYPVDTVRCVARPDEKSAKNKVERYNKVAYEAAKQSMRGIIPRVHEYGRLSDFDFSGFDLVIIPYEEQESYTMKDLYKDYEMLLKGHSKVAIVIGTEGGFEKSEVDAVVKCGGIPVTLGKRILRTETAGMAAVAMLMALAEG